LDINVTEGKNTMNKMENKILQENEEEEKACARPAIETCH